MRVVFCGGKGAVAVASLRSSRARLVLLRRFAAGGVSIFAFLKSLSCDLPHSGQREHESKTPGREYRLLKWRNRVDGDVDLAGEFRGEQKYDVAVALR